MRSHPPLWLLLTGFDLSSVLVGPVDFAEDCCKSPGLIQPSPGSAPVWRSIREGASVDCDLERVMLIGQPGNDNLGPEVGAQTTASYWLERYSRCDCSAGLRLALFFLWPSSTEMPGWLSGKTSHNAYQTAKLKRYPTA